MSDKPSPACPAPAAPDSAPVSDEYRKLVQEAGLPPEAVPSSAFFAADVDDELVRAMSEAASAAGEAGAAAAEAAHASAAALDPAARGAAGEDDDLACAHILDNNDLQAIRAAAWARGCAQPLKIGVLVSGSGTNLQALIDRIAQGRLDAQIVLVVASRPSAYGLKRAEAAGIQTLTLSKEVYADPIAADEVIAHELMAAGAEYVVMAGYMRKVHAPLLATFPNRVVNLHPALLPSFQGAHGIQDAYDRGVKVTGVTVHFANAVYDQGPIIAQEPVRVQEGWSVEELESAIHAVEHDLYPHAVQLLAEGRVQVRENLTVAIAPPADRAACPDPAFRPGAAMPPEDA